MRRLVVAGVLLVLIAGTAIRIELRGGPSASQAAVVGQQEHFVPVAVSFVSSSDGFELGHLGCHSCAVIRVTHDGGKTWQTHSSPRLHVSLMGRSRRSISDLAFANRTDGWLFGPGLWDTDTGGRAWSREAPLFVLSVQVGDRYVYALAGAGARGRAKLWRTAVGSELWETRPIPALGRGEIGLAVSGRSLMLLRAGYTGPGMGPQGKLWNSEDAGARWKARPVPCGHEGGASLVARVQGRPGGWLLDCFSNVQSSQQQHTRHRLYLTRDDGRTWRELAIPTRQGAPTVLGGVRDHFFLGTESGGTDGFFGSFDGGRHWHTLLSHAGFLGWADLQFLDAHAGFLAGATRGGPRYGSRNHVYRTDDGGRTWRPLP